MKDNNPLKNNNVSQKPNHRESFWIDKNYLSLLVNGIISEIKTHYNPKQEEWTEESESIKEFSQVLRKYRLDKKDDVLTVYGSEFPYEAIKKSVEKYFDKEIRIVSELSEEIETLYFELINIKRFSKKKLEGLVTFFKILSGELTPKYSLK